MSGTSFLMKINKENISYLVDNLGQILTIYGSVNVYTQLHKAGYHGIDIALPLLIGGYLYASLEKEKIQRLLKHQTKKNKDITFKL